MGFDRQVTNYNCGCYYEYLSHDVFNYKKDHQFVNVCGKHLNQTAAMEDENERKKQNLIDTLVVNQSLKKQQSSQARVLSDLLLHHLHVYKV